MTTPDMKKKTLWTTAILKIDKRSDKPLKAQFEFDWVDFSLDDINDRLKGEKEDELTVEDQYDMSKVYELDQGAIKRIDEYTTKGIYNEETLKDIGRQIWKLFPKVIQNCLEKFDLYALEISKTNPISIIIRTDILYIPWDLCVTRCSNELKKLACKEIEESEREKWFKSNWFIKYRTSMELIDDFKPIKNILEKEKKNVLLLGKTCQALNDDECEDFENEYTKLMELIEFLKKTENINIRIYEAPNSVEEFNKIESDLKSWDYDLALYLGPYKHKSEKNKEEGMVIDNPNTKRPEYLDPKSTFNVINQPLVFLDACCTANSKSISKKGDSNSSFNLVRHFISKGASAYIGTIQKIETITATVFAKNLLYSIFVKASSLSKAMYDARVKTYEYFFNNFNNKELFRTECCSFSLCGNSNNILLNSFRYRRSELLFIYPKVAEQYFVGFNKVIYPASIPGVELCPQPTIEKVIERIDTSKTPFVADVSIMEAAKLISKCKIKKNKKIVIIGGLFRLKDDINDCSFYYNKSLENCKIFYQEDRFSTVTIMALAYLLDNGLYENFKKKINQKEMLYEQIYKNNMNSIEEGDYDIEPFVLAAKYKKFFDENIKKRRIKKKFTSIPLYKYFSKMIKKQYKNYKFPKSLPAEVLIARKEDIVRDDKLFIDIFTQWGRWKEEKEDIFLKSQEVIFSFDEEDIETIINFTKFVHDKLDGFSSEIEEPLEEDDFHIIHSWRENEKELKKCRNNYLELLNRDREIIGCKLNKKLKNTERRVTKAKTCGQVLPLLEKRLEKYKLVNIKLKKSYSECLDKINHAMTIKRLEKYKLVNIKLKKSYSECLDKINHAMTIKQLEKIVQELEEKLNNVIFY